MGKLNYNKVFSLFIVIVMIGSVFLYASMNMSDEDLPENAVQVGEYTFYETQEGYFGIILDTNVGQQIPILFRLDPRTAEDIHLDSRAAPIVKTSEKIYFTYNPNYEEIDAIAPRLKVAMGQLSRIIPLVAPNVIPVVAQTEDVPNSTYDDLIPLKTCADTTETTTVVLFEIGDANQVLFEDNCVKVQGVDGDGLINASDKLGMNLVNIKV